MKANELRIGNWVLIPMRLDEVIIPSFEKQVRGIGLFGGIDFTEPQFADNLIIPAVHCAGIPLTEEWLLKFGFNKINITDGYFNTNDGDIIYGKPDEYSEEGLYYISFGEDSSFCMSEYGCLRYFEYVHQLQNLYFALTGEELEQKSPPTRDGDYPKTNLT